MGQGRQAEKERTYETAEDFVAWFDRDLTTAIIDGIMDCRFAVRAESAIQSDTFHGVMQDLVVTFGSVHFGVFVDGWEMLLSFVGEVVIQ